MTTTIAQYWETRYRRGEGSGSASRGRKANRKAGFVNKLIARERVRSVVDWGCGDGRVAMNFAARRYIGLEVSAAALSICRNRIRRARWQWRLFSEDEFPHVRADLALSLDVLFHLTDDEVYRRYLAALFASAPLVCIHASNRDEAGRSHVLHREFLADVPAAWVIVQRPANECGIGFWVFRQGGA
jgi:SAM-dependent methyltransferase